ncbi:glycoside hydrolase family 3 C-terminal domain-containing protein [Massilia antarctica]|uniref:glycoside hydrolase family 3 C-terminal domain-containing protein n=1 Tax=Massilia antarctica TaxID=2765360 RepID=UPI0006BB6216|nr:glycoside hydrolase family 3 C-terminal domain-containing protein [Massilia sp. H27-R4]MCY0915272.1 glycoside hydrolase family 3 C-terminal domain-containing protein [Massilia sp. H27-R4]CUI05671.1 Beta-glucosidase [Janthinobacterium sp. CG23_2]CUU29457.1 Beta-glucosidase [Janthinobacterium sp. CG23_2]
MSTRTTTLIKHALAVAIAAALPLMAGAAEAPMPWMNRALSADQRATLVLKEMTQEEKLQWVYGYFGSDFAPKKTIKIAAALPSSAGYIPGVARLGLPELFETDAGLGVASQASANPRERTSLPSGLATAATWNPKLAYQGGAMIGAEARASGFNVMLAGGVNLMRDPRNGRNFEYAGEDPLLSGIMVGQAVKGIQSNHLISTVKHYALNNQETGRNELDARIGDVAARTSDLLAMQLVIELGDPGSVMCAYNRVNGPYACENAWLLNEVLKQDWGFKGYVMSDWGAVHSTVASANNGLDQQSGSEFDKSPYFAGALEEAVKTGSVAQSRFDNMVYRILYAMFDKGVVDHPVKPDGAIDFAAHGLISRTDAEESMVLLKNDGQVLPLRKDVKTIAVIGGYADQGVLSGGGSSQVYPIGGSAVKGLLPASWPGPVVYHPSAPVKEIAALAPGAKVVFDSGADPARAAQLAASADAVIVFGTHWIGEANDAVDLSLPDKQDELIAAVAAANPRTVVVLETSGPVLMPWLGKTAAVLQAWYPGTRGGEAIARVLFGDVNPSGHLPATFPASLSQLPRPVLDGDPARPQMQFRVDYHEGAAVGYKWFDLKKHKPLFPFGHGLSYTQFAYSALAGGSKDGQLQVRFKVSNTGKVAGKDVAQLYVAAPSGARWEAPKRLAGWDKVDLQPGETREVILTVEPRMLAVLHGPSKTWRIAKGKYKLLLAQDAGGTGESSIMVDLPARKLDLHGKAIPSNEKR